MESFDCGTLIEISGPLQLDRLKSSIELIVSRYDILRTAIEIWPDGQPVQVVYDSVEHNVMVVDFSGENEPKKGEKLQEFVKKYQETRFDLSVPKLFEGVIVKEDGRKHHLFIKFHHILLDGWSLGIIVGDIFNYEAWASCTRVTF